MAYLHRVYLREHGCGFLALLPRGIIQHLRLKGVELCQLHTSEVPLNLLLVHHPERQGLFGHLPIINLLLHCALEEEDAIRRYISAFLCLFCLQKVPKQFSEAHLRQEPVHIDCPDLAKAVDPEDTLDVVGGVPGGVKDDHPVSGH